MAPRKAAASKTGVKSGNDDSEAQPSDTNGNMDSHRNESNTKASQGQTSSRNSRIKKRKEPPTLAREGPRKSARSQPPAQPSPAQLVKFLLGPSCVDLVRPEDEKKALSESRMKPDQVVTYGSTALNPFQELVCAMVLSRPISHTLGLRTIRTLFNDPYHFTGARAMSDAGNEKLHRALWDARTQHKAKTADQLHAAADVLLERYTSDGDKEGEGLGKVLGRSDVQPALDQLSKGINGLGPTGCGIFRRRVQWLWEEAYPYVDSRSGKGLRAMGLPDDGDELRDVIAAHWVDVEKGAIAGRNDEQKRRRALAVILEMATGADLEGKVDEVLREAAKV